ncbi:MAG: Tat pathway signal protein [Oscillospiraceae bacterium]|jgi:hypothetical protein|nr:Tat pathway signal protein [Oscillospiraceae bacterium]
MDISETAAGRRGLSSTGLKGIALALMVLDHIHYFFGFTGWIPEWFSMLGRLSAPLFLFCVVEGFTHTRNRKKYFLKVYALSAAMSGVLILMSFFGLLVRPDGFYPMNGMMTSFAILMIVWQGIDWLGERRYFRGLAAIVLPLAWPLLLNLALAPFPALRLPLTVAGVVLVPTWNFSLDACLPVLIEGILLYLFRKNRLRQAIAFTIFDFLFFFVLVYVSLMRSQPLDFHWTQMFTTYYEWYGAFAGLIMLCYNGQRGSGHKAFFYAFYPAHIYLLYFLSWGLYHFLH